MTLLAAFWAAAYLIPYKAVAMRTSAETVALPMLLSAAVLNTVWLVGRRTHQQVSVARSFNVVSLVVAVLLALLSAVGNEAMARALAAIGPGPAAVLLRTQVVFVALGGILLLGERVGWRYWLGALVAFCGFAVLHADSAMRVNSGGVAWAVVAAATFGGIQLAVRKTIDRIDTIAVNGLRLWLAAGLLALIPGRVELMSSQDTASWGLCIAASLFGPVISRLLLMEGLKTISATLSTLTLFVAPVFAFLLGAVVLDVWPQPLELAGCALILVGVGLPLLRRGLAGEG